MDLSMSPFVTFMNCISTTCKQLTHFTLLYHLLNNRVTAMTIQGNRFPLLITFPAGILVQGYKTYSVLINSTKDTS